MSDSPLKAEEAFWWSKSTPLVSFWAYTAL